MKGNTSEFLNNLIYIASAFFLLLIAIEIYFSHKRGFGLYSVKETLTSFVTGIIHRSITLIIPFAYKVYFLNLGYNLSPFKFEPGFAHFVVAFLISDCAYYWQHRLNHQIPFFWSFHEVHHSSNELNLMTAVRVSWIMPIFGAIFYLPVTLLGIMPEYVITSLVLVFYGQWWCHTSLIGKIPLIEGVIDTPSAHRMHHSPVIEESCSNYAGILMLWDRVFGTYKPEVQRITKFGISDGHVGHNPVVVNFRGIVNYFRKLASGFLHG